MALLTELNALGANTKEALTRVMDDEDLYVMMLGMFTDALKSDPVREEEFHAGDLDPLIRKVHTLKGTAGNLSITPLFESYTQILGLLRQNEPAQAQRVWKTMLPVQEKVVACIERYR